MKISRVADRFNFREHHDDHGLKFRMHRYLIDCIEADQANVIAWTQSKALDYVHNRIVKYAASNDLAVSSYDLERLAEELVDELTGYGPLQSLLADENITEVLVNGPNHIVVEENGRLHKTEQRFIDDDHVLRVVHRMLALVGRRLDESSPMVDTRLPDGSRVNAVIPPLALDGPCISIRKFRKDMLDSRDLLVGRSLNEGMLDLLKLAVSRHCNILITGGTGTGKTTFLNMLSRLIDSSERIVTIEDTAELQLGHDHVVRLETRPPNAEGAGEVTARELMRNVLRMRPDRIILGEVRSVEVLDLLQAMNSGHDGSMSTLHANSADDSLLRLEMLIGLSGHRMSELTTRQMLTSAVDLIVHLERLRDGRRLVADIRELLSVRDGAYVTSSLFHYNFETDAFEAGEQPYGWKLGGRRYDGQSRLKQAG